MRYHEIINELRTEYQKPLIRVVGRNFPDTFLHGTAKKNIRSLSAASRPKSSVKKSTGSFVDFVAPPEMNEFNAVMFLADPRQPQQARMFSQGKGNGLAVVRLKPGTWVLDLSDEVTRTARLGFGGNGILHFFSRPAITNDLTEWHLSRVSQGYKDTHPDYQEVYGRWMDPASADFRISTWQDSLVPYCQAHGIGAIRFADEILVTERSAILDVREADPGEIDSATTTRTWSGSRGGLYTDQKTGAHDEAGPDDDEQAPRS